jgi:uroporphyrin-III C-methyltransferase/precorrin-2 dehydrogenase/sirohydrochlorin ferrochelatase
MFCERAVSSRLSCANPHLSSITQMPGDTPPVARLNTFPVSVKVAGRRIVIVGGDEEALAKARLAAKTNAEVVVFAEVFEADFSGLDVTLVPRAVEAADFSKAALAFIADHGAEGARALEMARAAGVPVNEVDVPENCDFFTPAIVDRAPISIAISSEGDAPVLARLVRARIEAMLSPRLGDVARLAGAMREKVAALLGDGVARRRYYEALVTAPGVESALAAGQGEAAADALLAEHARAEAGSGVVWLIGAGPRSGCCRRPMLSSTTSWCRGRWSRWGGGMPSGFRSARPRGIIRFHRRRSIR